MIENTCVWTTQSNRTIILNFEWQQELRRLVDVNILKKSCPLDLDTDVANISSEKVSRFSAQQMFYLKTNHSLAKNITSSTGACPPRSKRVAGKCVDGFSWSSSALARGELRNKVSSYQQLLSLIRERPSTSTSL